MSGPSQMIEDKEVQEEEDDDFDRPLDGLAGAVKALNGQADSFHGPAGSTLAKYLPQKHLCQDHTVFRILEGSMSKYTIQGSMKDHRHDFIIQRYSALCEAPQLPEDGTEPILVSPAGLPLVWDTSVIPFETLVSELRIWEISAAQYHCLDIPHLSISQFYVASVASSKIQDSIELVQRAINKPSQRTLH